MNLEIVKQHLKTLCLSLNTLNKNQILKIIKKITDLNNCLQQNVYR